MTPLDKNIMIFCFLVVGMIFIGSGLTGMVVSQSCCLMPFCSSENLCDFAKLNDSTNDNNLSLYMGSAIFASSLGAFIFINRK